MRAPMLTAVGTCSSCNQQQEIKRDSLCNAPVKHGTEEGKECIGSGYTANDVRHVVKTDKEAEKLARFILEDKNHVCLQGAYHSMACGDRRNCEEERLRLSKALAAYYLEKVRGMIINAA